MAGSSSSDVVCCSHRECIAGVSTIDHHAHSYTEVSTVLPSKSVMNHLQPKLKVDWNYKGGAQFHKECWSELVSAARKRKKAKAGLHIVEAEKIMIKEAAKTAESHDSLEVVTSEAQRIADMIRSAKHLVAFTGAGISTSAGIGDFRGKNGKWTEMDREKLDVESLTGDQPVIKRPNLMADDEDKDDKSEEDSVSYEDLRPTYTHEALAKLMDMGFLKYIISQNADSLHLLSGISGEKLSELHGNVFIEYCPRCKTRYQRNFYVMDDTASEYYEELQDHGATDIIKPKHAKQCHLCGLNHRTGRRCSNKGCKQYLIDTIINFHDHLEEGVLSRATEHAQQCDLIMCLGTSLTVTPASDLVTMGKKPLRIVICNRQSTQMDRECLVKDKDSQQQLGSRVFGDCDILMRQVMQILLPTSALQQWEANRDARMKQYDQARANGK